MEGPAAAELTAPGTAPGPRRVGARAAALAVAGQPRVWAAAVRQARALVPQGWWRRRPFLPLPDRDWLRFRMATAYGDAGAELDVEDLLVWLAWTDTTRPAPRTGTGGADRR